jgi:hypothetical protein
VDPGVHRAFQRGRREVGAERLVAAGRPGGLVAGRTERGRSD